MILKEGQHKKEQQKRQIRHKNCGQSYGVGTRPRIEREWDYNPSSSNPQT